MDFSETTIVYDIKVGRCSELNEYMNLYEYQRSRSLTDLGPRSLRFFSSKTARLIEAKFHVEPHAMGNESEYTNCLCHMTKMAPMPIYGKYLKNLLLWNQKVNDLGSWYVASGAQVLPSVFN